MRLAGWSFATANSLLDGMGNMIELMFSSSAKVRPQYIRDL